MVIKAELVRHPGQPLPELHFFHTSRTRHEQKTADLKIKFMMNCIIHKQIIIMCSCVCRLKDDSKKSGAPGHVVRFCGCHIELETLIILKTTMVRWSRVWRAENEMGWLDLDDSKKKRGIELIHPRAPVEWMPR